MANDNEKLPMKMNFEESSDAEFDLNTFEADLEDKLKADLAGMVSPEEDLKKIGDPSSLGDPILKLILEQINNQIAVTAGEDFIKENGGLNLDLRNSAHIQTAENHNIGEVPSHNPSDYKERHDTWVDKTFQKDNKGNIILNADGTRKLKEGYRSGIDDPTRPRGSKADGTDMDHTISIAEYQSRADVDLYMTKTAELENTTKEAISKDFVNSKDNLRLMDASANRSKGDSTTPEWIASGDADPYIESGKINEEQALKDHEHAEKTLKKKVQKRVKMLLKKEGRKSQREEALRMGKNTARAVLMQLLLKLLKKIVGKLVVWLKTAQKTIQTLINSIKEAISSFLHDWKQHLSSSADIAGTTVATAIFGPIIRAIKSAWSMLKQGFRSLKEAINWLKDPANKGKPFAERMLHVGKIIVVGLTGFGAISLGQTIEKGLMAFPLFAIEIPLLGSIASIIGIFLGAVVAGIIGAIAMSFIDSLLAKRQQRELTSQLIEQGNTVLNRQETMLMLKEVKLEQSKATIMQDIQARHEEASEAMKESLNTLFTNKDRMQSIKEEIEAEYHTITSPSTKSAEEETLDVLSDKLHKFSQRR